MDANPAASGTGAGGGPAPFLLKTYDMVDDSVTDEIVSWSATRNSFVVWNPPEFARILLPTYFKHNNFSSFIRQLNTYGFRKIDPERWEFANEEFVKDQKHLLKNIHRRKPIHSHSSTPQSSTVDPERAAFEEEIDKLSREKNSLEKTLSRFKQQQPATKLQLEELTKQVDDMEQRQDTLLTFLKKAVQNQEFVEHLAQKLESMDLSADNKKRRLPHFQVSDHSPEIPSRSDFANVFHHDFSNKLRLELSPSVSDVNFLSNDDGESSNDDGESPQIRLSENCIKTTPVRPFAPDPVELLDTGTSFGFQHKESEGDLSCQLNLTLASCVSQINPCQDPDTFDDIGKASDWTANGRVLEKKINVVVGESESENEHERNNDQAAAPAAAQARVNDVFWEQFLTEKPGSSEVEDTSLNFRSNQDDRRSSHGSVNNSRNLQNLTL